MKKVLIISGSLPPIKCGVGDYNAKLSHELSKRKLDFEILSTDGVDTDISVPVTTVPNWRITSIPKMLRAIKKSRAQIIHIQYPAVGYRRQLGINLLPYALKIFKPKLAVIVTLHEYSQSRWIGRLRNKITIWPADKVVVSNQADKDVVGKKALVFPIGANIDKAPADKDFYQDVLAGNELSVSKPTLLFFGYPFPAKRLELLLDAMQEPKLQAYQLLLIGGGFKDKSSYQELLRQKISVINQGSKRVAVLGFLDEAGVSKLMQQIRYFVMPNKLPLSAKSGSAIAALQNGMIIISSGSDNPTDTAPYSHLKNCFLLDEATPESIAAAIDDLENSTEKRQKILSGVKELQKYFSWDSIVDRHIKLYEEL